MNLSDLFGGEEDEQECEDLADRDQLDEDDQREADGRSQAEKDDDFYTLFTDD